MEQQLFNFGGANQYGSYPALPTTGAGMTGQNIPGIPTNQGSLAPIPKGGGSNGMMGVTSRAPSANDGYYVGNTYDPKLTGQFFDWLSGNVGSGLPAFNWSSALPSNGEATAPGALTAQNNALLQLLMGSFTNGPMAEMLNSGNPISTLPAWKAMVDAEKINIAQNEAQLREQFSSMGNLAGTPFGTAESNYRAQTALGQNAQLTQAETAALESAQGRRLSANSLAGQLATLLQGLDQSSIDRMYQEFQRTQPQNNPLLQYIYGASTTFPPTMAKPQGGGGLASLLGLGGNVLGGLVGGLFK